MKPQGKHGMLPSQTLEERARHSFHVSIKETLLKEYGPGNKLVYERSAAPRFAREHNRPPENRQEVRRVMEQEPYYQLFSAIQRAQQELYLDSTQGAVERQAEELAKRAKAITGGRTLGTLKLDPSLPIPRYQSVADIHCLPGSYFMELFEDDVMVGARYDIGIYMYALGGLGSYNDDQAQSAIQFINKKWPDLKPKRILDMGCTGGACTLPYVDAFPDADVHGIDLSAPALRYAHARAESMGKRAHFSQQNAECTNFEDESFDLITSHILLHETSRSAVRNVMKEAHRLLKPGGVVLHMEVPVRNDRIAPFDAFMRDWSTFNNNEPFWGTFHDMDLIAPAVAAGFAAETVIDDFVPSAGGGGALAGLSWHAYGAQKSGARK